jgi:predicted RNA-binding Zn-ribbon protein involved in translation (DUF1610 family)
MSENRMIATVRCGVCGWEGPADETRRGERVFEKFTRDDGTQHPVPVVKFHCPQCDSSGLVAS